MRYIVFTRDPYMYAVAYKLHRAGADVCVARVPPAPDEKEHRARLMEKLYSGLLPIRDAADVIDELERLKNKNEVFILFDFPDLYVISEHLLKRGFTNGVFPTEQFWRLEKDRLYAKRIVAEHYPGLKPIPAFEFDSVTDARQFIEKYDKLVFVLKGQGQGAETIVPRTRNPRLARTIILDALETNRAVYEKHGFTLEVKLEHAIEFTPVMVFWNGEPLFSLIEFENKPLGAFNTGPLTGGIMNLTIKTELDNPLNEIAFPPFIRNLVRNHPGLATADVGILLDLSESEPQLYFTEFCAPTRWGWDGIISELMMCDADDGAAATLAHFEQISRGIDPINARFGAAVALVQMDSDARYPGLYKSDMVVSVLPEIEHGFFPYCIYKDAGTGALRNLGVMDKLGVAAGASDDWEEAVRQAYNVAEGVGMLNLYYRPYEDFVSRDYLTSIPNRVRLLQEELNAFAEVEI